MGREQQVNESDALLSAEEAARLLGVSEAMLNRLRRRGNLLAVRVPWGQWWYQAASVTDYQIVQAVASSPKENTLSVAKQIGAAPPIVKLVNMILVAAISRGASDIHIEPDQESIRVRLRIDGTLQKFLTIPKRAQAALIGRFKQIAGFNVSERPSPKVGSLSLHALDTEEEYQVRIAFIPVHQGENIVLHLLAQGKANPFLYKGSGALGLTEYQQGVIDQTMLSPRSGLSLIVGLPGSGVTTTAYNTLVGLNLSDRKIHSLESLPEYVLPGVMQSYFGEDTALFLKQFYAVSRLDTDILFLGDINRSELANWAVEAVLEGRRVIATMTAKDIEGALWRWERYGIDRETLQKVVKGITAQRLLRRVCPDCAQETTPSPEEWRWFGEGTRANLSLIRRGAGCDACKGTGYRGRFGVFETLAGTTPGGDFVSLRTAAIQAVRRRETTPEEVQRVLGD